MLQAALPDMVRRPVRSQQLAMLPAGFSPALLRMRCTIPVCSIVGADLPQASFASKVEVAGDKVNVTREGYGGLETLGLSTPAVISTDLRLKRPRDGARLGLPFNGTPSSPFYDRLSTAV